MINSIDTRSIENKNVLRKIYLHNEIVLTGFKRFFNNKKIEEIKQMQNVDKQSYYLYICLNKIYNLLISLENSLHTNDIHLSVYVYRYSYELYIKTFYLYTKNEEFDERYTKVLDSKFFNFKEFIKNYEFPIDIKNEHNEKYQYLSKIVHPNRESFEKHLELNNTNDAFDFVLANTMIATNFLKNTLLILSKNVESNFGDEDINQMFANYWVIYIDSKKQKPE